MLFESLASAGVIANATMATVLTRTGRIFFLAFVMAKPPTSVRVIFNPELVSKVCAVVWCEIDHENSVG